MVKAGGRSSVKGAHFGDMAGPGSGGEEGRGQAGCGRAVMRGGAEGVWAGSGKGRGRAGCGRAAGGGGAERGAREIGERMGPIGVGGRPEQNRWCPLLHKPAV